MILIYFSFLLLLLILWSEQEESKEVLYFAYGSNTNSDVFLKRIENARYVGTGLLEGYRVDLHQHATLVECDKCSVKGVVWALTKDDFMLLDEIEKDYIRVSVRVATNRLKTMDTYFLKQSENKKASSRYVKKVLHGYKENDIRMAQLRS